MPSGPYQWAWWIFYTIGSAGGLMFLAFISIDTAFAIKRSFTRKRRARQRHPQYATAFGDVPSIPEFNHKRRKPTP